MNIFRNSKLGECAHECFFQSGKEYALFSKRELLEELKRMSFMNCDICQWQKNIQFLHLKVYILQHITDIEKKLSLDFFNNMTSLKFLDL